MQETLISSANTSSSAPLTLVSAGSLQNIVLAATTLQNGAHRIEHRGEPDGGYQDTWCETLEKLQILRLHIRGPQPTLLLCLKCLKRDKDASVAYQHSSPPTVYNYDRATVSAPSFTSHNRRIISRSSKPAALECPECQRMSAARACKPLTTSKNSSRNDLSL